MNRNRALATLGAGIFLGSAALSTWFSVLALRATDRIDNVLLSAGCSSMPTEVQVSSRILTKESTATVTVTLTNSNAYVPCIVDASLIGTAFKIAPSEPRKTQVDPKGSVTIQWSVRPEVEGNHDLLLSVPPAPGRTIGVVVTSSWGLLPEQSRWLSLAGSILGPLLTVPWWLEKIAAWRAKRRTSVVVSAKHVPFRKREK